ncbi:MAG: hypothetical protein JSR46_08925 [Verrucomicrobia bacterium]|nr:hypothetical protein [Verrucomicrobiota bacterium]
MKVTRTDISATVQTACADLTKLSEQISEKNVSNLDEGTLITLIAVLQRGSNQLAREIGQSIEVVLDPKLKTNLVNLIQAIQHSPAFSQALGPHQVELMGVFTRFENSIRKAEQKVTKVDSDPLHKQ